MTTPSETMGPEPAPPSAVSPAPAPHTFWAAARGQVLAFFTAVRFLTRVPVPSWLLPREQEGTHALRASAVYFPLVGALVGAATAGVILGAERLWPLWLAVLLGLAFEALLTGALHEDAVADFCDAFGGGWTREDVLRILKDSRVGSFGVLGLTFAVLLRAGSIVELAPAVRFGAIVASATLGRWLMLLVMALLAPLPDRPSASRDIGRIGLWALTAGTIFAAPGVVLLCLNMPLQLALSLAALVVAAAGLTLYLRRRLGGATGDCLGFACYVGQIMVLLIAAARV